MNVWHDKYGTRHVDSDAAPDLTRITTGRDWAQDRDHDDYRLKSCDYCASMFAGHPHRSACKLCAEP